MKREEVHGQILKRLEVLSRESLQEVHLFLHFLQMREKLKPGMDDIGFDLAILDETERIHLESEFENYKERYPHEG
jgi:hypothetical protein